MSAFKLKTLGYFPDGLSEQPINVKAWLKKINKKAQKQKRSWKNRFGLAPECLIQLPGRENRERSILLRWIAS